MAGFDVDTDDLRAVASTIDDIVRSATPVGSDPASPECGHAGLSDALTGFLTATTQSWTERLGATTGVASNLRRTASRYEGADADGVADLTTRRAVIT